MWQRNGKCKKSARILSPSPPVLLVFSDNTSLPLFRCGRPLRKSSARMQQGMRLTVRLARFLILELRDVEVPIIREKFHR